MKKAFIILLFFSNGALIAGVQKTEEFDELEYFSKPDIVENGILEIHLEVFTREKKSENMQSCYQSVIKFDDKAQIVEQEFRRLSSSNYFEYQNGTLSDWGWKDKGSGEKTSIAKELEQDKNELEKNRQTTYQVLQVRIKNQSDFKLKHERHISDPCLGVDGDYEIVFDTSANLPVEAIATLISKDNTSAKKLFMYFKYVVYK